MPASKKRTTRERARVRGLEDKVFGRIDKGGLFASEVTPEHKYYSIAIV